MADERVPPGGQRGGVSRRAVVLGAAGAAIGTTAVGAAAGWLWWLRGAPRALEPALGPAPKEFDLLKPYLDFGRVPEGYDGRSIELYAELQQISVFRSDREKLLLGLLLAGSSRLPEDEDVPALHIASEWAPYEAGVLGREATWRTVNKVNVGFQHLDVRWALPGVDALLRVSAADADSAAALLRDVAPHLALAPAAIRMPLRVPAVPSPLRPYRVAFADNPENGEVSAYWQATVNFDQPAEQGPEREQLNVAVSSQQPPELDFDDSYSTTVDGRPAYRYTSRRVDRLQVSTRDGVSVSVETLNLKTDGVDVLDIYHSLEIFPERERWV
jgi:hypothetical protein